MKVFEIRDRATFIPAVAFKLDPENDQERYLLSRAGYGKTSHEQGQYIHVLRASGGNCQYSPHAWNDSRTMYTAHKFIIENWTTLKGGEVIDVAFILGEKPLASRSERFDQTEKYV